MDNQPSLLAAIDLRINRCRSILLTNLLMVIAVGGIIAFLDLSDVHETIVVALRVTACVAIASTIISTVGHQYYLCHYKRIRRALSRPQQGEQ